MAAESRFKRISSITIKEYMMLCRDFVEFDEAEMELLAVAAIRYYKGSSQERARSRHLQSAESRWYKSVRRGRPDYSVYEGLEMVAEMWACWRVYSRGYLLSVEKVLHLLPPASSIADLGCGCGHTAASLTLLFPQSRVVGTNIPTSFQYGVAGRMGLIHGFKMAEEPDGHFDLVFASEYFEHHERPLEHLGQVVSVCSPKVMIVANSFNSMSVGHFPEYRNGDGVIRAESAGRAFNLKLKGLGYEMVKMGLWNNRPAFWVKQ